METIRIEINVNLGMTDTLERVLRALIQTDGPVVPPDREKRAERPSECVERTEEEKEGEPAQASVITPEEERPVEERPVEEPKKGEWTDDMLKYAMDQTLVRICGPEWNISKEGDVRQGVRNCTKVFKEISRFLGAEKPTALRQEDRPTFVRWLDSIKNEPGTYRVEWKPLDA